MNVGMRRINRNSRLQLINKIHRIFFCLKISSIHMCSVQLLPFFLSQIYLNLYFH